MKTILRTIASISVLLGLGACQQFEIDTQMTPEKAAASIRLVCDALDSYTLAATSPENIVFNVSSNTPWTISRSSGADWITVTPSSSSSSALISDVIVSAENNTAGEDRSAVLTITAENVSRTFTINIKQNRLGRLFVTPVAQDYAAAGGPLNFTIQTNQDWEVRSDASWLSFNRQSGAPDPEGRTITIVATAETSTVMERTATVTVTAGGEEETFDVVQKGRFELSEISDAFENTASSKTFTLRTDLPWSVAADQAWLSFDATEGTGDGKVKTITASAAENTGAMRSAKVTVTAGDVSQSFEVAQKGLNFEIVTPESTEISYLGGVKVLEVNSDLAWTPECDNPAWTVEKTDASHMTVTAPANNKFAATGAKVAIASGANRQELSLTQDVAFTFEGNCEVLADGSVKLTGDKASRVVLKDGLRYGTVDLAMGEVHFASGGNIWFVNDVTDGNWAAHLYNWCAVGKTRLRAEGNVSSGKMMNAAGSNYMSKSYDMSEAQFNAMTRYRVSVLPDAGDPSLATINFVYNDGADINVTEQCQNPFYGNEIGGQAYVGFYAAATADTWYVIKSFDVTFIAE